MSDTPENTPFETPVANDPPAKPAQRRKVLGGWLPGWPAWVVLALCAAMIVFFRYDPEDQGMATLYTLIFGFIAFVTLAIWFYFLSSYSRVARLGVLVLSLLLVAMFFSMVRVEWTGNMQPRFSLRSSRAPGEGINPVVEENVVVDVASTTSRDFPGFLGPERNSWLPGPELARDWQAQSPELVWRRDIGAGWAPFSAVNGYAVTLEQIKDEEVTTCYDIESGKLVWISAIEARHDNPLGGLGPRSAPTIDGERVYTMGATGVFRCLDGATGEDLWSHDLPAEFGVAKGQDTEAIVWGRSGSPLIVNNLVIVPAGGPVRGPYVSLVAYDKLTGEEVWRGGNRQISYSSPSLEVIAGTPQIVYVCEAAVAGFDPETGRELWHYEQEGRTNMDPNASQALVIDGELVFSSKGYSLGAALWRIERQGEEFVPELLWDQLEIGRSVMKTKFSNVVIHEGYVYGLDDGVLQCIELATGDIQWKRGRYGYGQILGVGDLLLAITDDGEVKLVELNPEKFVELGEFQAIEGKTWNNLCLYGPYLLVRNGLEAACYRLPLAKTEPAPES